MKLPIELRLQIYGHLLRASDQSTPRRALAHLRPHASCALGDGMIVLQKSKGAMPHAHSRSALPSLAILNVSHQIRSEAIGEIYRNAFEVVAHTQRRKGQLIFHLPGFLRLDLLRHLMLITHAEVSRFQSCFAYDMVRHLSSLRTLSVAMKTTTMGGGPDFHSCLEALNLVLWVKKDVKLEVTCLTRLLHHDHPAWVCPRILELYFETFADLRGVGHTWWTADVAVAYDKGLEIAKSFGVSGHSSPV